MDKERRRSRHRIDSIQRNLECRRNIFVRVFVEADMAIADLQEAQVGSCWQRVSGFRNLSEGFRNEDTAADGPKQAGASPSHALQKAATIDSVVFVVVRN